MIGNDIANNRKQSSYLIAYNSNAIMILSSLWYETYKSYDDSNSTFTHLCLFADHTCIEDIILIISYIATM